MPVEEWLACRRAGWHAIAVAIQREGDQALASYIQAGLAFAQPPGASGDDILCLSFTPEWAAVIRSVAAVLDVVIAGRGEAQADAGATIAAIEAALRRNR